MATGGVAAVEAHEQVLGLGALEVGLGADHVGRHGVVDIQQRRRRLAGEVAEILTERAVDIHLARHRHAARGQPAVDIARHEAKRPLERRPALVGEDRVLPRAEVGLGETLQRHLEPGQPRQQLWIGVALAQLSRHLVGGRLDGGVLLIHRLKEPQQVQLGVFHHLRAHVIQLPDRGVAGVEVLRPRPKGEYLQTRYAQQDPREALEVRDPGGQFIRRAHGHLRDVDRHVAQVEVDGGIEHAAEGVAATVDEILARLLAGCARHHRPVDVLGEDRQRPFRSEVAEVNDGRIAAGLIDLGQGRHRVGLVLNDRLAGGHLQANLAAGLRQRRQAGPGQFDRKAIPADADKGQRHLRGIR